MMLASFGLRRNMPMLVMLAVLGLMMERAPQIFLMVLADLETLWRNSIRCLLVWARTGTFRLMMLAVWVAHAGKCGS